MTNDSCTQIQTRENVDLQEHLRKDASGEAVTAGRAQKEHEQKKM